jgi:phospholipid/cholesterol/gamma-HCH transport system substrate-binding protein
MNATLRNLLVGIFVLGAISVFVGTILFLKPTVGDGKQKLTVRFSDINNINVGTRVLFAGRAVGEVESIIPVSDAREQPTDELGRVYFYQLTLKLDSHVKVYNTDQITIQTSGLLGEKSIGIVPKSPPAGVTPKLIGNQPIYADSVDSLSNALIEFSELSSTMEETFAEVKGWMNEYGDAVGALMQYAGGAMNEAEKVLASVNEGALVKSAEGMMSNLDKATADLALGKGTLGKLLVDSDLYLQGSNILNKANTLMGDLNHYGLLFHLNKQWQRTQLQKLNQLDALHTPQAFKTYFQSEIDEINSSMTRLSMVVEMAQQSPKSEEIFQNEAFKRDFLELMQRSDALSQNLRLYNQQLQEATNP